MFDHLSTAWPVGVNALRTGGSVRQMSQGDVCWADARRLASLAERENVENEKKEKESVGKGGQRLRRRRSNL